MMKANVSRFRKQLKSMPALALVGCITATAAAYAGEWHWLLELFSHFRMQYVAVLLVLALFYAWQRQPVGLGIAMIFGAINVLPIAGLFATQEASQLSSGTEPWVLLSANLNSDNDNVAAVLDNLGAEQADVVLLQEYNLRWAADLAGLSSQYPHQFALPREDEFGLALYSRWPLLSAETVALGDSTPAIVAELATDGGPVRIVGVHLRPPLRQGWAAEQDRQFAALTQLAAETDMPLAIVGDFNATPWSADFRRWTDTALLHNGLGGHGLAYTWPTAIPFLWIPIDACVVNSALRIVAQRRGNRIGSDHYPLVTALATHHG